jgi:ATP-dependent RNA helicase DeaD
MAERSPEDIAAALVRAHRAAMPQAEELIPNTPEGRQADKQERHLDGFEAIVWFRMDIGRRQNAEARWILPLLCRRGHITRNEIGAIRIAQTETHFQVPRAVADKFAAAVARTVGTEDGGDIVIEVAPDTPREVARHHRKANADGPPRHQIVRPTGAPRGDHKPRPHKGPHNGPGNGPHKGPKKFHRKGRKPE